MGLKCGDEYIHLLNDFKISRHPFVRNGVALNDSQTSIKI
jgi:hypothetical protein